MNDPLRNEPLVEDLDWLAFRYVTNELTESEEAEFLVLLEHDQTACEALARQSLLVEATRTGLAAEATKTLPPTPAVQTESRFKALVTMCLATAAVLALIMPLLRGLQGESRENKDSDLALRWAAGIEGAATTDSDFALPGNLALDEENGLLDDLDEESLAEASLAVPDWMLAAVAVQSDSSELEPAFSADSQPVEN